MALIKRFDLENLPNVPGRLISDELSPRDLITMFSGHPILANFAKQTRRRPTNLSVSIHPSESFSFVSVLVKAEFRDREPLYWYWNQEVELNRNRKLLKIGEHEHLTIETIDKQHHQCLVSHVPSSIFMESTKDILNFVSEFYEFPIRRLGFHEPDAFGYPKIKDFCGWLPDVEELYLERFPVEGQPNVRDVIIERGEKGKVTKFTRFICEDITTLPLLPFIESEEIIYNLKLTKEEVIEAVTRQIPKIDHLKWMYVDLEHLEYEEFTDLKSQFDLKRMTELPRKFAPTVPFQDDRSDSFSHWIQTDTIIDSGTLPFWIFRFSGFRDSLERTRSWRMLKMELRRYEFREPQLARLVLQDMRFLRL